MINGKNKSVYETKSSTLPGNLLRMRTPSLASKPENITEIPSLVRDEVATTPVNTNIFSQLENESVMASTSTMASSDPSGGLILNAGTQGTTMGTTTMANTTYNASSEEVNEVHMKFIAMLDGLRVDMSPMIVGYFMTSVIAKMFSTITGFFVMAVTLCLMKVPHYGCLMALWTIKNAILLYMPDRFSYVAHIVFDLVGIVLIKCIHSLIGAKNATKGFWLDVCMGVLATIGIVVLTMRQSQLQTNQSYGDVSGGKKKATKVKGSKQRKTQIKTKGNQSHATEVYAIDVMGPEFENADMINGMNECDILDLNRTTMSMDEINFTAPPTGLGLAATNLLASDTVEHNVNDNELDLSFFR